MTHYQTITIGGGASGMMAAATAGKTNDSVLLIEKNKSLGQKLGISGGGRCNILNAEEDTRTLLENYGDASKFLYSAFNTFGMQKTKEYFESIGLPIKIEARKRAFPVSESAKDVVNALSNQLTKHKVTVMKDSTVQDIITKEAKVNHIIVDGRKLTADKYILATGGTSKPETGSTGDGFKWLENTGHTVRAPTPNVTPLSATDGWIKYAQGLKIQPAKVTFYCDEKKAFSVTGDVLITHFGISGPVILNSANKVSKLLEQGNVTARIDCLPELSHEQLDQNLVAEFTQAPAKQLKNSLSPVASAKIINIVISILENQIDFTKNNSEVSRKHRTAIVDTLKALPLSIDKLMGFEKAVVADGGVDLKDIDMRTMRSNIVSNLYITGDLLNINRPSGGYSLQLCWTSGYIAGSATNSRA